MTLKNVSKTPWSDEQRQREIDKICSGLVAKGRANREIYRVLIESLFPPGSGLPGPVLTRDDMRDAVQKIKPGYKDVFRRVRELQGEEGLRGLVKDGTKYQLQHLAISGKREPRQAISAEVSREIALQQGNRCAVCGEPLIIDGGKLDVDHKVPRQRGGTSHESNLQVLCKSCNVAKSSQCSNCNLSCNECSWAYPKEYRAPKLLPSIILMLNELAQSQNRKLDEVANELLEKQLREEKE